MADETPQPKLKPKLRWYQYRLWHLFLVTLILALWLGWVCHKANQQKKAVESIENLGGTVVYDYQVDANGDYVPNAEPPGPVWFRDFVGVDFLANPVDVNLQIRHIEDDDLKYLQKLVRLQTLNLACNHITDAGLEHIRGMTRLEVLYLCYTQVSDTGLAHLQRLADLELLDLSMTQITDAGLVHLKGLAKLEVLWLAGTQVTDAGLEHLQGMTKLEALWLVGTQVTDDGVKKLQQALPNCVILHDRKPCRRP